MHWYMLKGWYWDYSGKKWLTKNSSLYLKGGCAWENYLLQTTHFTIVSIRWILSLFTIFYCNIFQEIGCFLTPHIILLIFLLLHAIEIHKIFIACITYLRVKLIWTGVPCIWADKHLLELKNICEYARSF